VIGLLLVNRNREDLLSLFVAHFTVLSVWTCLILLNSALSQNTAAWIELLITLALL
jgi:hypothetical protein